MMRSIAIIGGSGFVGRQLAAALAKQNWQIKLLSRRSENKLALSVLPQLQFVDVDYTEINSIAQAIDGCAVVVNLVGILNENRRDGSGFRAAHVSLTENIIQACKIAAVGRYLHMSALNADAKNGASHYLRTKGEAEDMAHNAEWLFTTSFRPSVIFGPEDSFFNRFATLLKFSPVLPIACPQAKFAPVFVDDVVQAMLCSIDDSSCYGQAYDLCGPEVYTLRELVQLTAEMLHIKRMVIGLPHWAGKLQARIFEFVPTKPLSLDNFNSLQQDSLCEHNALIGKFGIQPRSIKSVMPLAESSPRKYYDQFRSHARRDQT
jgi:uncharacterized protein YbjT (DUF2867 family)